MFIPIRRFGLVLGLFMLLGSHRAGGYSLMSHEQLIDLTWQDSIVPLLLSRYPTLTPAQLEHARAYAYGGCVIQDIGYYPFGDESFSNLTHYVRSGDFVVNLFRNAGNADELAFAVGALSHYVGDTIGHSMATNTAVPVEFPKLKAKYGSTVNYAEGEHQHVQTEFAFDIHQIAHHRFAPVKYLRHIGLGVPVRQVALAFYQTYGLREDFSDERSRRVNVRGYRFAVRAFIPRIAYALTVLHRHDATQEAETPEGQEIEKEVAAMSAQNNWALYQRKAGIGTYSLAGLIFILPKIGPLKLLSIKGPTHETELDYLHSMSMSTGILRKMLARFTPPPAVRSTAASAAADDANSDPPPGQKLIENASAHRDTPRESRDPKHPLPNRDLDTGQVVKPGGYPLTDSTYADLLHMLTRTPNLPIPPGIKADIQGFYGNPDLPITTKKTPAQWSVVQADLTILASMPTTTDPDPFPTYGEDSGDLQ